jgi:hypothetical protein
MVLRDQVTEAEAAGLPVVPADAALAARADGTADRVTCRC